VRNRSSAGMGPWATRTSSFTVVGVATWSRRCPRAQPSLLAGDSGSLRVEDTSKTATTATHRRVARIAPPSSQRLRAHVDVRGCGVGGIAERGPRVAHDLHGHPSRTVVDDVSGRVRTPFRSGGRSVVAQVDHFDHPPHAYERARASAVGDVGLGWAQPSNSKRSGAAKRMVTSRGGTPGVRTSPGG